ncbi:MAG: hypothetical protein ACLFR2_05315 [Candidatus Kapaibacterium sp.]
MKGILVTAFFVLLLSVGCGNNSDDNHKEHTYQQEKPIYDSSDLKELDVSTNKTQIKSKDFNSKNGTKPPVIENRKEGSPMDPEDLGKVLPSSLANFESEPVSYGIRLLNGESVSNAMKQFYNLDKNQLITYSITDVGNYMTEEEYNYYGRKPESKDLRSQELEGRFENLRYTGYMTRDIPESKVYLRFVLAERYLVQIDVNDPDMYGPAIMELAAKANFEVLSK